MGTWGKCAPRDKSAFSSWRGQACRWLPNRALDAALGIVLALLCPCVAVAQSPPPITVPIGGPPEPDPSAITFDGWLLRGAIDTVLQSSNNYLLTIPPNLSGWAVGINPHVTAEWSDGIHSTVLYGSYQHLQYKGVPTDDAEVTGRQSYSPLPDLKLSLEGDYTHRTITSTFTNSIPTAITTTTTTVQPNGNTILPNGTIVSPSGQIIGQSAQTAGVAGNSAVNPYDQFTATGRIEKIWNGGIVTLGGSLLQVDYDEAISKSSNYTARTVTEDVAFWLGPLLYAFSDGAYSSRSSTQPFPDSSAYRVIGGLGIHKLSFWGVSGYVGEQGSQANGSGSAGGIVYGGAVSYDPIEQLTISATFDHTTNNSSQVISSNQALTLPIPSPIVFPVSSSGEINVFALRTEYRPTERWSAIGLFGYSDAVFPGEALLQRSWVADLTLQYEILRNLSVSSEIQHIAIVSNLPGNSTSRDLFVLRSSYRF